MKLPYTLAKNWYNQDIIFQYNFQKRLVPGYRSGLVAVLPTPGNFFLI